MMPCGKEKEREIFLFIFIIFILLFVTAGALGARERYEVQQGQHGKKRNERERYSDRIGFFEPDVEEQLCD